MSKLLGELVRDRISGQKAEVIGYESSTDMYRIEFLPDCEGYEPGHSSWRKSTELVAIRE